MNTSLPNSASTRGQTTGDMLFQVSGGVGLAIGLFLVLLLGMLCLLLAREIIGRRKAEKVLRESENRLRLMIDEVEGYGIFMVDTDGCIATWNIGATRLTGFSAAETIGRYGNFFCTPDDVETDRHAQILARASEIGREENEGWRIHKNGTRFLVHATTTPLYDSDAVLYGYLKVLRDVTASRQSVEALEASEYRFKFALEGAGEGVWDWNEQTGAIYFSPGYYSMLGYDESEFEGNFRSWKRFVHPDDLGGIFDAHADHLAGRAPNYAREFRMLCKDGSYKWVLARGMVVSRDASGRALRTIGTQSDISLLKSVQQRLHDQNILFMQKNEQLQKADQVKSEFLANMSHELRTPLNAVLGFTGTMLMELPGALNTEQKKQLEIVRDSGRHLLALINEVLDLSKIESGTLHVIVREVCCRTVISDVCNALMPLAAQKKLDLIVQLPVENIKITTDVRLLKQILINLVGNAIKFTDDGAITVLLRKDGASGGDGLHDGCGDGAIWIDVSDTGIGIEEADLDKLFLPFTQIDATLARRFEGSGLGLNVSKKYAEAIGAELHVDSSPGQGSRFSIRIAEAALQPA